MKIDEYWWNYSIVKVWFLFSIVVIVIFDIFILYIYNRCNFVLIYICSDWCWEENGCGFDFECVWIIRFFCWLFECYDIFELVLVCYFGKIR